MGRGHVHCRAGEDEEVVSDHVRGYLAPPGATGEGCVRELTSPLEEKALTRYCSRFRRPLVDRATAAAPAPSEERSFRQVHRHG